MRNMWTVVMFVIVALVVGGAFALAEEDQSQTPNTTPENIEIVHVFADAAVIWWDTADPIQNQFDVFAVDENGSEWCIRSSEVLQGATLFSLREPYMTHYPPRTDVPEKRPVAGYLTSRDYRQHQLSLSGLLPSTAYRVAIDIEWVEFTTLVTDDPNARVPVDYNPMSGTPRVLSLSQEQNDRGVTLTWTFDHFAPDTTVYTIDKNGNFNRFPSVFVSVERGTWRVTIPRGLLIDGGPTTVMISGQSYLSRYPGHHETLVYRN